MSTENLQPGVLPGLILLAVTAAAGGCPRRPPIPPATPAAATPQSELSALLATERALRLEQGELLWALWVRGEPGGVEEAYERFPGLMTRSTFERLEGLEAALPASQDELAALGRTLLATRLARATAEVDGRIARLQATATLEVDGMTLPWRELGPRLSLESDLRRREQLREAARPVQERHRLLLEERRDTADQAAAGLGLDPIAARDRLLPAPPGELVRLARQILGWEEVAFQDGLLELARSRTGKSLAALPGDSIGRLFAPSAGEESGLPPGRLLDDLELLLSHPSSGGATLAGAASRLAAGENPRQAPLPLCLPVDPPGDLRLAIAPREGLRARLDALRETVICSALSEREPGSSAGLAAQATRLLTANARGHEAEHGILKALGAGELALPGLSARQASELASRQALRLQAAARRDAALLLLVLEPAAEGTTLPHHHALLGRALGLFPATEATALWEEAWAKAHLPTLALRVLAAARAHGLDAPAARTRANPPSDRRQTHVQG